MKTIEILSNGRQVQFTTKSVTIDGTEYLYSHISELRHSQAKQIYGFKCDGEVIMLPYEAKDEQVLKVIFSQVKQMHRKPASPKTADAPAPKAGSAADAGAAVEAPADAAARDAVEAVEAIETAADAAARDAVEAAADTAAEAADAAAETAGAMDAASDSAAGAETADAMDAAAGDVMADTAAAETDAAEAPETDQTSAADTSAAEADQTMTGEPAEGSADTQAEKAAEGSAADTPVRSEKEQRKEAKRREKEQRKADKEAAKREKMAQKSGAKAGDADLYKESVTDQTDQLQKSSRFKKAIIVFVIILAVFALLGVAYYFLIGPASDPQIGPNTTDQTKYNDINDMINDLEN